MSRDGQKRSSTPAGRSSKSQESPPTKPASAAGPTPPKTPSSPANAPKPPTASSSSSKTSTTALVGTGAVGGIIGAVLGVFGYQALQGSQGLSPSDDARMTSIEQAASQGVADLGAKIAELEEGLGSRVDAVTSDISNRLANVEGTAAQATALASGQDEALASASENIKQQVVSETAQAIETAITPVSQQLNAINNRLAAFDVESAVASLGAEQDDTKQALGALDAKVGDVETSLSSLSDDLSGISEKVTAIEPKISELAAGVDASKAAGIINAGIVLASSDLNSAARSHGSVEEPAARLRDLTEDLPGFGSLIDTIETAAAQTKTNAELIAELDKIEADLSVSTPSANDGASDGEASPRSGWLGQTVRNISGLVPVPQSAPDSIDDQTSDPFETARSALNKDDPAAALDAMSSVDAEAAPGLVEWRGQVESGIKLDTALDELSNKLRQHFASSN